MKEDVTILALLNVLKRKIEHATIDARDGMFDRSWLDIWTSCSKIENANNLLRGRLKKGSSGGKTILVHQHIERVMIELKRESNAFLGKNCSSEDVKLLKEKNVQEINTILQELEELREQTPLKEPLTLDDLITMAG